MLATPMPVPIEVRPIFRRRRRHGIIMSIIPAYDERHRFTSCHYYRAKFSFFAEH